MSYLGLYSRGGLATPLRIRMPVFAGGNLKSNFLRTPCLQAWGGSDREERAAMSTYFSRELVERVNAQMTLGHTASRGIPSKVRSYVERKTQQEIADALSWAWRKNVGRGE